MVNALGFSLTSFDPASPGRLCRGREQWIESYGLEKGNEIGRLVISGSKFTDETARDAWRGLPFSGVPFGEALRAVFPKAPIFAACEDGHPLDVPEDAVQREDYVLSRPGGRLREWRVRWVMPCSDPETVDEALQAGADAFVVLREPPDEGELSEKLREALFLLQGYRSDGAPARRFQAAALLQVLEHVQSVVLAHLDKHAPSLGLYGEVPVDAAQNLTRVAEEHDALAVPFAIPPMLARWDRALWELRSDWDSEKKGEFPVPAAEDGGSWGRQRRRSRGSDDEDDEE